ncbi:MAG: hypothetical protein KDA45_11520, partial [Planctomycetales bacterium]|nr:hypothetical protein [Planctomycetales bacterium]
LVLLGLTGGCQPLSPKSIDAARIYDSPDLRDGEPQIQRGEPRKVLDALGWAWGIPSKVLLWDRRVENHRISATTEAALADYLQHNHMSTVRVRLNQYRPGEDWRRLTRNKAVGAPWRYTLGAVSVLGETLIPGRVFGGDHYNPFTNTIHLYSDVPAIALHEGAHAKDFARRKWKGTYAASYLLPVVPLAHESIASRDVVAYLEAYGTAEQQAAAYRILYPAYGTYAGNAMGYALPAYATPLYVGSVLSGHAWGRYEAAQTLQRAPGTSAEN